MVPVGGLIVDKEPLSQSLLASVTAPHPTSKVKFIELHNPSHLVELKYTGTITFKWRFVWEQYVIPGVLTFRLILYLRADTNSSGDVRNASCFESLILPSWLP